MNEKFANETKNEKDPKGLMGSIDDFDIAMKSAKPIEYFREYIKTLKDSKASAVTKKSMIATTPATSGINKAEKYFIIYQLCTVYTILQVKQEKERKRLVTIIKNALKKSGKDVPENIDIDVKWEDHGVDG